MHRLLIVLFSFLSTTLQLSAANISGSITDSDHQPVPFVRIIIDNGKAIASGDENGKYQLLLSVGKHTLRFEVLGYHPEEIEVRVQPSKQITRNIRLKSNETELSAIEIHADKRDIAKEVMRNASGRASFYRKKYENLRTGAYYKISMIEERNDTTNYPKDSVPDPLPRIRLQNHLSEIHSVIEKEGNSKFRETVLAAHEFSKAAPYDGNSVAISVDVGEKDPAPQQHFYSNNYLLQSNTGFTEFDFNEPLLDLPSLAEKKFQSPLAPLAAFNYRFDLGGIFYKDGKKYYSIRITPLFKVDPLFEGKMVILDSLWAVTYVEFTVRKSVLKFHDQIRIQQFYEEVAPETFYPVKRLIDYSVREGKSTFYGTLMVGYSDTEIPRQFEKKTFTDETRVYDAQAFEQPEEYWQDYRKAEFTELEKKYAHECDSLQRHYTSEEYLSEKDSVYNDIRFMDFILYGVGYRNRSKGYRLYFNPLIAQVNPVGIGGYRHRLGGSFQKDFDNDYTLETTGEIDYGFRNRDIRGKAGAGLTYVPLKFVRTFITVGDYYDMINTYASIGSIFSRSNYVRTQSISIAQRMEIINGLFAEVTFDYSDQKPITGMTLERWSERVFGSLNNPIDFTRYIKSEIRLDVKYRIRQKYMIKRKKKIILGTAYPELSLVYRKGINGLFQSEVNFDFIEVGARHEKEIGRWGNLEWSVLAGSFINKSNLRILEHRYFRGSDALFFSDPLRSFQLLGPTLSTPNAFLRANYFHHLNGIFLNKIPLINRLKLTEAVGAAMLTIPDQNFFHTEMYAGLERVVRIRRDLFRFGIYGATSDNTLSKARFEIKFGVNFYNSFTRKWNY